MMYVATFYTHFGAVQFTRELAKIGIKSKMMPVPRKISSSCGTCVKFDIDIISSVPKVEDFENLYKLTESNTYDKINI